MRESDDKTNVRHFRSGSRIFAVGDKWWFSTREGERGPFKAREDAERELHLFISQQVDLNSMVKQSKTDEPTARTTSRTRPADPHIWDAQIDVL